MTLAASTHRSACRVRAVRPSGRRVAERVVRCSGSVSIFGMTCSPMRRIVSSVCSWVAMPAPNKSWSAPALSHSWHCSSASSGSPTIAAPVPSERVDRLVGRSRGAARATAGRPVGVREGVVVAEHVALQVGEPPVDHGRHGGSSRSSATNAALPVTITLSLTYAPIGSAFDDGVLVRLAPPARCRRGGRRENPSTPRPLRAAIA